jgi:V8-like Glu-specific endopeptidase
MPSYTLLSSTDLQQSTFKPLVRIELKWSNGQSVWGSGVLVGANDVLTAAHLFGTSSNATVTDLLVYPGYYYGPSLAPAVRATHWASSAPPSSSGSITASEIRGDLALISLNQTTGFTRGFWGVGASFANGTALTAGYPGTLNGAPAVSSGWVNTLSVFQSNALNIENLYAQPGSSGSPIYVLNAQQQPTVVGVLSTGSWAVNVTDTNAGQTGLSWVEDQISLNNLDVANSLPRIGVSSATVKLGQGVTQLTLHFPVTLSYAMPVDTHLTSRLSDAAGRNYGTEDVVVPAGNLKTSIDFPVAVPTTTASVSRQWTLDFYGADNALFTGVGGAAALTQQASLRIEGSTAAGVVGGSGLPESVVLSNGNDVYQGLGGDDALTGGGGVDLAIYRGMRQDYQLQKLNAQGDWQVRPTVNASALAKDDGLDTLTQFERLQFSDVRVALDVNGNAGNVAKIFGAVLGKEALQNKVLVGYGLAVLDQGEGGYQSLMAQALQYKLGASFSDESVVRLLYKNLLNSTATQGEIKYWSGEIQAGVYNPQTLATMAANTATNASNINLIGLSGAGLEFV